MKASAEVKSLHQAGGAVGVRGGEGRHPRHADHLGEQVPHTLLQARLGVVISEAGKSQIKCLDLRTPTPPWTAR